MKTKSEQKKLAKLGHTIIGKLQYFHSMCGSDMDLQEAARKISRVVSELDSGRYK